MTTENLVGSDAVRRATGTLLVLFLVIGFVYIRNVFPERSQLMFWLFTAIGIMVFVGLVHTTRGIYLRWLAFGKAVHGVVVTVLFGAIYLFIVSLFALVIWPFDVLRVRKHAGRETYWIQKKTVSNDIAFFQRLG
jgi:hypothetical protein